MFWSNHSPRSLRESRVVLNKGRFYCLRIHAPFKRPVTGLLKQLSRDRLMVIPRLFHDTKQDRGSPVVTPLFLAPNAFSLSSPFCPLPPPSLWRCGKRLVSAASTAASRTLYSSSTHRTSTTSRAAPSAYRSPASPQDRLLL